MNTIKIGETLRSLRQKRGITQETLANRLGVAPQSVSKWERNEGFPDITFLIPLAEYFDVTLDTLLGRDGAAKEQRILAIVAEYERLQHLGDHATKNDLIRQAYRDYPYDFRIVVRYVNTLTDDCEANRDEIVKLCAYTLDECTDDPLRYEAIFQMIYLCSEMKDYDRAEEYASRLPDLSHTKYFTRTMIYPSSDERDVHAAMEFADAAMENLLWELFCAANYRTDLTRDEKIDVFRRILTVADAVYPDFDCDVCHSGLSDTCMALFGFLTEEGRPDEALDALERALKHARAIDLCENSVVVHTSLPLKGAKYDMTKTHDGCACNSVWFRLDQLGKRYPVDAYAENERYRAIVEQYTPYAVADMTK
ncbi:MAG: helix-turn-helix transcriptional regulator [Clostridia bacterium]|nr:helix-turn-helix transcriptional regulator [Clostridia bacterium]